ncbi:MAG: GIY-YIG nuclease family protein [Hahellaceae bacterium]|jgi:hypothetical protein|nr:GIY-YIG nuclease family protein [Hahellaceae bacterium]MCP5210854.1 GIY-YIG nuclease family protein [Hahellaceae bacterium]
MIVYTLTNKVTNDVWVGTCSSSGEERFAQLCEAMIIGLSGQIFKDLRDFGIKSFTVEEYAFTEDREELKELFSEAMEFHNGKSLMGVKTSIPKAAEPKPVKRKTTSTTTKATTAKSNVRQISSAPVKEKIATGRASAAKEKIIKEKIALEKAKMEAVKSKQVIEQADEMAALLARLDARSASMKRR